ncbi:hypothetical protein [Luteimonas cucumeris]|uniref:hypothetical protein n=1 Tax=Luteimonas cucumeris TaxID=985012 RepID=UPI001315578B|nr:hypothetical protein [Luteimonas cucumeris]
MRIELLDQPGERRSHQTATPRGGGIAIVLALLVALAWLIAHDRQQTVLLACIAAGIMLVAVVGGIDDHRPLSPWLRLAVHALASLLLAYGFFAAHGDIWLALAAFLLSVGLTNVWNFMDGIDGLAASQAALLAAAASLFLGGSMQALALALCAACSGFLPFNFPRARIFLGDVGSGALGFAVAALCVGIAGTGTPGWPLLLLPLSTFLVDAALTLGERMLRGERWWTPHVTHTYQIWARTRGRHSPVTLAYAAWTVSAIALWWLFRNRGPAFITMMLLAWYTFSLFIWRGLRSRQGPVVVDDKNPGSPE